MGNTPGSKNGRTEAASKMEESWLHELALIIKDRRLEENRINREKGMLEKKGRRNQTFPRSKKKAWKTTTLNIE
jgi:hypothetical protein